MGSSGLEMSQKKLSVRISYNFFGCLWFESATKLTVEVTSGD